MRKKLYQTISVFVLLMFISGCLPTFKYPVADFRNNKMDERLYGMWIKIDSSEDIKNSKEYEFIQILPSKRGVEIVAFSRLSDGAPETMYFSGYPAIINGNGYLNYRFYLDADVGDNEYYLAQYKIMDNGLLKISHADEKVIKQLIEDNKLQGIIEKDDISVTANKSELLNFLQSNNIFDTDNPVYFRFKDIGLSVH